MPVETFSLMALYKYYSGSQMKKDAEAEQEFCQCIIAQQNQVWGEGAEWPEDGDGSTGDEFLGELEY